MKTVLFQRYFFIFSFIALSAVLNGCQTSATHPSLVESELPPMIRLKELFFNIKPETSFKVSPDGKKIAWLGEKDRKTVVFFKTIGEDDIRHNNHNFTKGTIHFKTFHWAQDNRHILYSLWEEFADQHHVFVFDTRHPAKVSRNLTPDKNNSYKIHQILRNDPGHIILKRYNSAETIVKTSSVDLVKVNLLEKRFETSLRVDQDTGSGPTENQIMAVPAITEQLTRNPGNVYSWITDRNGRINARIILKDIKQRALEMKMPDTGTWRTLLEWTIDDYVKFVSWSENYQTIYLRSNVNRDRISLIELDLETLAEKLVAQDPASDIESVVTHPASGSPIAAFAYPDYQKIHLLDQHFSDVLDAFNSDEMKSVYLVSADNNERLITLRIMTSTNIHRFLYNRDTREKTLLATQLSPEESRHLSPMEPVSFKSRDGIMINAYMTIPAGTSGRNLPMVVMVHGGPWLRDYWKFNRIVQLLANRGYVVMQVNFRGSFGYGRAFMEAAKGEFAGKMLTDLIDGVNWAVEKGIADPDKVAIYGYSYGGYASMSGLSFFPDVFACGVSVNGIANLESFLNSKDVQSDDYRIWYRWQTYVGDPENAADLEIIRSKSPLYNVDRIKRPLLIVQGAQDRRVPRSEADAMVKALKTNRKKVDYILFPRESHYIFWWSNRYKMYNNIEKFLAKYLGGRKIHSDSI